jgi:catechol 2,3-dioxygenase-like lactoylglutathione lyase family enzyme
MCDSIHLSAGRCRSNVNRGCSSRHLQANDDDADALSNNPPRDYVPLAMHHTALRTRDIEVSIQFYGLLGFEPTVKFRAGPARAAWLEQRAGSDSISSSSSSHHRLELIEVPSYLLNEAEGTKKRALDLAARQELLGQNHFALDVTESIQRQEGLESLSDWIDQLNQKSLQHFGKTLRVAVPPTQRLIGKGVFELAFLYDADGALVELLHKQTELQQEMSSGWEPWDGKGFVGARE